MNSKRITQPNPKLEVLRKEGLTTKNNIHFYLLQLKEKTKRIHTAWLFDVKGKPALQTICIYLDGTKNSFHYEGWMDFADELGVERKYIWDIDSQQYREGKTDTALRVYAQSPEATLDNVVIALQAIQRFDVIQESYEYINRLATYVLADQVDDGYGSMSSEGYINDFIIRPSYIPRVPSKLQPIDDRALNVTCQSLEINTSTHRVENEFQTARAVPRNRKEQRNTVNPYDCTVMLTFASDGLEFVPEIAQTLRRKRENGQRIGVLILDDHSDKVNSNPQDFIHSCFQQVNYVMPVITEGYLRAIWDTSSPLYSELDYTDYKHIRYIYTLMNDYYANNGCLNRKIRCIVPDQFVDLTQIHSLMKNPIFRAWNKVSKIEDLGERMLRNVVMRQEIYAAYRKSD